MLDKHHLKNTILNLENEVLETAQAKYQDYLESAKVNYGDVRGSDDLSQAFDSEEYVQLFDHPIHTARKQIDIVEKIDFSEKDTVELGSAVKFNDRHFVVAVATEKFECQGTTFMGISEQAPVYKAMQGKKAGDTFEINGRKMTIQEVS